MTKTPSPTRKAAAQAAPAAAAALSAGTVLLDGKAWRISPLKVGPLKRAMVGFDDLQKLDSNDPSVAAQMLDLMAETVHQALRPLHPDLTKEGVEDLATQVELGTAFGAVLRYSGAKEATPGEAASQGR